jgi:hypothetical protein
MNRKQLRAIAVYHSPKPPLPVPSSYVATPTTSSRDKYSGNYKVNQRGGVVQTNWIGRSNSISPASAIAVNVSGNKLWGKN